jgi:hypothetical protein
MGLKSNEGTISKSAWSYFIQFRMNFEGDTRKGNAGLKAVLSNHSDRSRNMD